MIDLPETPANLAALGVAWVREEDWPRWCAADPDFEPDYHYWFKRAVKAVEHYQSAGKVVHKVAIDIDEFLAWSRATGAGVGTGARAAYVANKTMRKHTAN